VNIQEDNTELKNIPTILNGCVSDNKVNSVFIKNIEVSSHHFLCESYVKLLNSKNSFPKSSQHKILFIGDSHLRGCAGNMKLYLNAQFQVSGCIKPGADTKSILEQASNEINNLSVKDCIILCCGSNDIGRVNSSVVFNIIGFIKRVTHTKVILLTVPYRHDLKGAVMTINEKSQTSTENYINL
jgi:hypothetical protein